MRYVRLNCSMKAFCSDLPGWISRNSMPRSAHQVMKQSAISSGLLSSRIAWGCPPPGHDLLQHADHAIRRERCINLNRQAFSHPFIPNFEGPESATAVQGVTHEVHGPHRIRLREHRQRLRGAAVAAASSSARGDSTPDRNRSTRRVLHSTAADQAVAGRNISKNPSASMW